MADVDSIVRAVRAGSDITRTEARELADAIDLTTLLLRDATAQLAAVRAGAAEDATACAIECDRWRDAVLALIERDGR